MLCRTRPAPLEDEAELAVVVKNTFLEVSDVAAVEGTRTAPASYVGRVQRLMAEPVGQFKSEVFPGLPSVESDCGETETTASTPSARSLWPATPASPGAPVRISLVELMGNEGGLAAALAPANDALPPVADAATTAPLPVGFIGQAAYWDAPPPEVPLWEAPAWAKADEPPPPPLCSPKLPRQLSRQFEDSAAVAAPPHAPIPSPPHAPAPEVQAGCAAADEVISS